MDDTVLESVGSTLRDSQISHVKFNFRGVGRSAGKFDNGNGECDDLKAVVDHLRISHTSSSLVLCGYSFGSTIVYAIGNSVANVSRAVLIAPPIPIELDKVKLPTDIVVGQHDGFCNLGELRALASSDPRIHLDIVDMADHFFVGCLPELTIAIERVLNR